MDSELAILAERALQEVSAGSRIGLGSGHAAEAFIQALAARVKAGLHIRAVATSEATANLARSLGIQLDTLDPDEPLDVTTDGADEVEDNSLNLIKGWGGALMRERIVAAASKRQVILATKEKLVPRLGTRGKLPVEVLPFAERLVKRRIGQLPFPSLDSVLREHDGHPFVTDNGNWILDCAVRPIADPVALDHALRGIPGVIDTGLFLGTASLVLLCDGNTVTELRRS
jgi:ribose 5-phosphate isomerase A